MRFLSVNKLVSEVLTFAPDTKQIYIAYLNKEAKKDQFGKFTAKPLYMVLVMFNGERKTYKYDEIVNQFGEPIAVPLSENKNSVSGVALCSISTEARYSSKLESNYFPRENLTPGTNLVREVNKIVSTMKEQKAPKTFDI